MMYFDYFYFTILTLIFLGFRFSVGILDAQIDVTKPLPLNSPRYDAHE